MYSVCSVVYLPTFSTIPWSGSSDCADLDPRSSIVLLLLCPFWLNRLIVNASVTLQLSFSAASDKWTNYSA